MNRVKIYKSNRLELLADLFTRNVALRSDDPLATEHIMVQSIGMGRWLSLEVASRIGVWANYEYQFPNKLLNDLTKQLLHEKIDTSVIADRDLMTWLVFRDLKKMIDQPEFSPLKNYLTDGSSRKYYHLCEKIADTFDQYIIMRPEMVLRWDVSDDCGIAYGTAQPLNDSQLWQPLLWRSIFSGAVTHRALIQSLVIKKLLAMKPGRLPHMPERISVFGVSALPKYYIDVIEALGRHIEVNYFLLSPTVVSWSDMVSEKNKVSRELSAIESGDRWEDMHLDTGEPLLSSMGTLGAEFFKLLDSRYEVSGSGSIDEYHDGNRTTLLETIQSSIFGGVESDFRCTIDSSIRISSCHSPMREVEVLYDQLLDILSSNSKRSAGNTIEPRDILVMTPDIGKYAPYIEAVFGSVEEAALKIPYSLADLNVKSSSRLSEYVVKLLKLDGRRFAFTAIADLVRFKPVLDSFGIREEKLDDILDLFHASGVRWGFDAEDRKKHSGEPFYQNSWEFGIDRILFGYGMLSFDDAIYNDNIPLKTMEGDITVDAGAFITFILKCRELSETLDGIFTLHEWSGILLKAIDDFFTLQDDDPSMRIIREKISLLSKYCSAGNLDEKIDFKPVSAYLESILENEMTSFGFIDGRVTFCKTLPMRALPFKVIAMIGMNDGVFPRIDRSPGFNLLENYRERSDRSSRNDDRYLFLETLISARERLLISYTGKSQKNDAEYEPSVLVSELCDRIKRITRQDDDGAEPAAVIESHRLQPYAKDYFSADGPLFSYSKLNCALSGIKGENNAYDILRDFKGCPIDENLLRISLDDLIYFFDNPSRFFAKRIIRLSVNGQDDEYDDNEPLTPSFSETLYLEKAITETVLVDTGDQALTKLRLKGVLPPGLCGEFYYTNMKNDMMPLLESYKELLHTDTLSRIDVSFKTALRIDGKKREVEIFGKMHVFEKNGLVLFRPKMWEAADRVSLWLRHLMMMTDDRFREKSSVYLYNNQSFGFNPVETYTVILEKIVEMYVNGLHSPLRFFKKSSLAYHEKISEGKGPQAADEAARLTWGNRYGGTPEGANPYFSLFFNDPVDDEFRKTSDMFYSGMKPYLQKGNSK